MESNQPSGANGIKDAIVTLPAWGIFLIGLLCISSLLTALWLLAFSKEDNLKGKKVAIVVDWLSDWGGAEMVISDFLEVS